MCWGSREARNARRLAGVWPHYRHHNNEKVSKQHQSAPLFLLRFQLINLMMHLLTKSVISSNVSEKVFFVEWNSSIEYFTHR